VLNPAFMDLVICPGVAASSKLVPLNMP